MICSIDDEIDPPSINKALVFRHWGKSQYAENFGWTYHSRWMRTLIDN